MCLISSALANSGFRRIASMIRPVPAEGSKT
jgi:hypothetical protein